MCIPEHRLKFPPTLDFWETEQRCKKDGNNTGLHCLEGNIWMLEWFWCIQVSFSSSLLCCNCCAADHLPWQFANPPGCSQQMPVLPLPESTFVQIADGAGLLYIHSLQARYTYPRFLLSNRSRAKFLTASAGTWPGAQYSEQNADSIKPCTDYGFSRKIKHCY